MIYHSSSFLQGRLAGILAGFRVLPRQNSGQPLLSALRSSHSPALRLPPNAAGRVVKSPFLKFHATFGDTTIAMAYKANVDDVEKLVGDVVGTGHCVPLVQKVARAPNTSLWSKGKKVKDEAFLAAGTAIATFNAAGKYDNKMDGTSHAAIYVKSSSAGIDVYDQWVGHPTDKRTIMFRNGQGKPVNDGDQFYVID